MLGLLARIRARAINPLTLYAHDDVEEILNKPIHSDLGYKNKGKTKKFHKRRAKEKRAKKARKVNFRFNKNKSRNYIIKLRNNLTKLHRDSPNKLTKEIFKKALKVFR